MDVDVYAFWAPRVLAPVAYEAAKDRFVVFGGADRGTQQYYADTWVYKDRRWRKLEGPGPPARGHARLVDTGAGLLLLGGYWKDFARKKPTRTLSDAWLLDGERWVEVRSSLASGKPPVSLCHHGAAWDPKGKRVVVFGGESLQDGKLVVQGTLWSVRSD